MRSKGITAKMLSKELKDLEMNELVKRTVCGTTPVTVEYELRSYGSSLKRVVTELHDWGVQHKKENHRKIRQDATLKQSPTLHLVQNKRDGWN